MGCSTFYHLCKRGINAILLERNKVTSGTTWHSAAMIWSLRGNDVDTLLLRKTRELQMSLEEETGVHPGWNNCGGMFVARTAVSNKVEAMFSGFKTFFVGLLSLLFFFTWKNSLKITSN